jgi:hypothetical protein
MLSCHSIAKCKRLSSKDRAKMALTALADIIPRSLRDLYASDKHEAISPILTIPWDHL